MKRLLSILLILILLSVPALGVLGVGDIVHDPISYANALLMLAELIKNYEQLKAQLDLQTWMSQAVPVDMSFRYRTLGTAWYDLHLPYDRFGNLSGWIGAANSGFDALGGYDSATVPLQPYGPQYSGLAPDEQAKLASQYASIELTDGTNVHGIETVGMLRGNAPLVEQSIQALEEDSLSLDPAMNTQIAVLNKINAASIASLRSNRDTNRALLSLLEQQVVDSKRRRDGETAEINNNIYRMEYGPAAQALHTNTITQSIKGFRW